MRLLRGASHDWAKHHLSHYVEGDLGWLARRRLELHAEECPECSRGIRALRSLIRLVHGTAAARNEPAPESVFDRVRADAARTAAGADPDSKV